MFLLVGGMFVARLLKMKLKLVTLVLTSRKACARNVMLLSTALTIFARMYLGHALRAMITNIGPIRNLKKQFHYIT